MEGSLVNCRLLPLRSESSRDPTCAGFERQPISLCPPGVLLQNLCLGFVGSVGEGRTSCKPRILLFVGNEVLHFADWDHPNDIENHVVDCGKIRLCLSRGGMCEWLKQAVLKTAVRETVPGVRIPLPPPLHGFSRRHCEKRESKTKHGLAPSPSPIRILRPDLFVER